MTSDCLRFSEFSPHLICTFQLILLYVFGTRRVNKLLFNCKKLELALTSCPPSVTGSSHAFISFCNFKLNRNKCRHEVLATLIA